MDDLIALTSSGNLPGNEIPVMIYARVSTKKQVDAGNLDRQKNRLLEYVERNGYQLKGEFKDIASGLNQKRRGLSGMLKMAEDGLCKKLIIEYPDRLARFGYDYIARHLKHCGVEIISIAEPETEDAQAELTKDLLSIVTSFSVRLYGAQGGRKVRQGFQDLLIGATSGGEKEEEIPAE